MKFNPILFPSNSSNPWFTVRQAFKKEKKTTNPNLPSLHFINFIIRENYFSQNTTACANFREARSADRYRVTDQLGLRGARHGQGTGHVRGDIWLAWRAPGQQTGGCGGSPPAQQAWEGGRTAQLVGRARAGRLWAHHCRTLGPTAGCWSLSRPPQQLRIPGPARESKNKLIWTAF